MKTKLSEVPKNAEIAKAIAVGNLVRVHCKTENLLAPMLLASNSSYLYGRVGQPSPYS